jgi:virginiamycin B lyase
MTSCTGRTRIVLAALAAAFVLSACSGSSKSVTPTLLSTPAPHSTTASITFVVQIPAPTGSSAALRKPRYVSPSTRWITASVTPAGGGSATTAGNACAPTQCSITIAAPIGADTFTISLYDAQGGNLLSSGQTSQTIVEGQQNTVTVVFGGVVAALQISPSTIGFAPGVASTTHIAVNELDADGNTIVAPPSQYPAPITLSTNDTTGTFTISPMTVTGPQQPVTVTYNGSSSGPSSVTISARTGSISTTATAALAGRPYLYQQVSGGGIREWPIVGSGTLGPSGTFGFRPSYLGIAVAPDGSVYSIETNGSFGFTVNVFPGPTSSGPIRQFNVLGGASAAIDGAGNFYAEADARGGIYVYPGNASTTGNAVATPLRSLLTDDTEIALGHDGSLYAVASNYDWSATKIDVFPPNAHDVTAPSRTLYPQPGSAFYKLAVGVDDTLYVRGTNAAGEQVFVYPPGASGTPAPSRTIAALSPDPAIAVDSSGAVYIAASSGSGIGVIPPGGSSATVSPNGARRANPAPSAVRRPSVGQTQPTTLVADIVSPTPAPPSGNPPVFATVASYPAGGSPNFFAGIASGSDGRVWATGPNSDQIYAVTSSTSVGGPGLVIAYPVPHPAGTNVATPTDITAGPDGALWFVEENGKAIGRISTLGVTTLYPLAANRFLKYIIAGPDGNLWFNERGDGNLQPSAIAKITTGGAITEYPLPNTVVADALAAGPDGNVYFVEGVKAGYAALVRVTPSSGAMTTVTNLVWGGPLTLGADNNFYVIAGNLGKLYRVTTGGAVSDVTVFATLNSSSIAHGSNSRLYLGAVGTGAGAGISIIGTDGTNIVNFPLPGSAGVAGVVQGPDGNVWAAVNSVGITEILLH